jgi:hypothetical protein
MTGMCHCAQLLVEMGVSLTFCLDWAGTMTLLVSASQIGRIIGMSHWARIFFFFFPVLGIEFRA